MTGDEPPSESLTLWEKLSLTWLVPLFATRCIKFLLFQRNPSLHWRQNLALALLKLYVSQHPNIAHTTVTVSLPPSSDPQLKNVPPPVLHFLTPVTAPGQDTDKKTTLLYFHGGGVVNPLRAAGHMPFILSLHKASKAHQTIILEYALAPEHPYPAQLIQAVAALSYLLTDLSLAPSDIILAGDSAGGQLVGALLAHLAKPSPYAPQVENWKNDERDQQFKAAVFISPWASMQRPGGASMFEKVDDKWDYLTEGQCARYQDLWDPKVDEVWANLCGFSEDRNTKEEEEVWRRVFGRDGRRAMVEMTLVTVGTAEVLVDSSRRFGRECLGSETVVVDRGTTSMDLAREIKGRDVVTVECVGEAHVQPALDAAVGYEEGVMMRVMLAWLRGVYL
ncbi:Alpha/Beta hydrolase protein [Neurospora crassa]|nr:Alpha/Beta hydrolase protein [Neurospora crassa]